MNFYQNWILYLVHKNLCSRFHLQGCCSRIHLHNRCGWHRQEGWPRTHGLHSSHTHCHGSPSHPHNLSQTSTVLYKSSGALLGLQNFWINYSSVFSSWNGEWENVRFWFGGQWAEIFDLGFWPIGSHCLDQSGASMSWPTVIKYFCQILFFKFKQFYSLCWHILVSFSSVEFSDLLAQIPWLICLAYAFYEVSIKFQVVLCLPKSQSLFG